MNFTFGIITEDSTSTFLPQIINDITSLNIPKYEIIIVGGTKKFENTVHIEFNETNKSKWITKKKNLITEHAKYENIVYLHDYITFDRDWYINFLNFGEDFKICMNQIINLNGERFRDWVLWGGHRETEEKIGFHGYLQINELAEMKFPHLPYLIPYHVKNLSKFMYISGSYWVAKKYIMQEFPLNENLSWGESEDVEWSFRVREKYEFSINENSKVKFLKNKDRYFSEISIEGLRRVCELESNKKSEVY